MQASAVRLQGPNLERTLAGIGELAEQGAGSETAARWTAEAAREAGDGRDQARVLRILAERVRRAVTFAPDEYGGENLQPIEETLEWRRAGDCDDFAIAMLALGRRAGLRGALEVFHEYPAGEDAPPVAVHVLPAFENPARPGEFVPVELTRPVPFGEKPRMAKPGHWSVHPVQESDQGGELGGFLDVLLNPIGSVVSAFVGASAAKSVAKEKRKGDEAIGRATEEVGKANAAADVQVALLNQQSLKEALAFGKDSLGLLLKLALVVTVGSLGKQLLTRSRSRAA